MIDREKPADERKHLRRSMLLLITVSIVLLLAGWEANAWKDNVAVKDVRVSGVRLLAAKDILALASVDRAQKLYQVDVSAIRRKIETNPYVESAEVIRDVRGYVSIIVHERVPVAEIVGEKTVYLDDSARVMPQVSSAQVLDLPLITGLVPSDELVPGRKVHALPLLNALALIDTARAFGDDLYHKISEVHIKPDGGLVCYTTESGVPVTFGKGNIAMKLAKLDGFWKEIVVQEGAQALDYVDLRFNDIVVARWNPRQELAMHERENP